MDYSAATCVIKFVTRSDLVGRYVGWTHQKTIQFLEANTGNVLLIDETDYNGLDDHFYREALEAINHYQETNTGTISVKFFNSNHPEVPNT